MASTHKGNTPPNFVGMYDFGGTLGVGKYSVVKLATHVITNDKVAVKVIDKTKLEEVELQHLRHEVRVMKLMRHPHVVRLYEIVETSKWVYLILELAEGGDMYEFLKANKKFDEDKAKHIFSQLVLGVSYCHSHRVAHRDLKPENVVFCQQCSKDASVDDALIMITDFGLSNSIKDNKMMDTWCGSMAYTAPEVLLQEPYKGTLADIWALGVILYMIVCGHHPFRQATESETLAKVMDIQYEFPDHVSEDFKDLVGRIIQREPSDRATLQEIMSHPWLCDEAGEPCVHKWQQRAAAVTHRVPEEGDASLNQCVNALLTKEEHERVAAYMQDSNISRADLNEALATGSYDYISSTYCLLAEKQLRRRLQKAPKVTTPNVQKNDKARRASERDCVTPPRAVNGSRMSMTGDETPASAVRAHNGSFKDSRTGTLHMESGTNQVGRSGGEPKLRQRNRPSGVLFNSTPLTMDMASLALSPRVDVGCGGRPLHSNSEPFPTFDSVERDDDDDVSLALHQRHSHDAPLRRKGVASAMLLTPNPAPREGTALKSQSMDFGAGPGAGVSRSYDESLLASPETPTWHLDVAAAGLTAADSGMGVTVDRAFGHGSTASPLNVVITDDEGSEPSTPGADMLANTLQALGMPDERAAHTGSMNGLGGSGAESEHSSEDAESSDDSADGHDLVDTGGFHRVGSHLSQLDTLGEEEEPEEPDG